MCEQDTLYNVIRDGMQHMTVYGYELKDTDVILGTVHATVTIDLDEIEPGTELKPGEHIRVDNSENVTLERDTSKQLSNGICHTKSEKTPEITRQDGVLNISDVQDTTAMSEPLIIKNADSYNLDTREQLNEELMDSCLTFADRGGHLRAFSYVSELLDRQAAITIRECTSEDESCCEACRAAQKRKIAELTAEREQYRNNMFFQAGRVADVTAERNELRQQVDSLTAEVDNLRKRNDSQADTIRRLRAEFDDALDDLARAVEDKRSHPF